MIVYRAPTRVGNRAACGGVDDGDAATGHDTLQLLAIGAALGWADGFMLSAEFFADKIPGAAYLTQEGPEARRSRTMRPPITP